MTKLPYAQASDCVAKRTRAYTCMHTLFKALPVWEIYRFPSFPMTESKWLDVKRRGLNPTMQTDGCLNYKLLFIYLFISDLDSDLPCDYIGLQINKITTFFVANIDHFFPQMKITKIPKTKRN